MKTIIIDGIEYNLTPKVLFKKGDWVVNNNGEPQLYQVIVSSWLDSNDSKIKRAENNLELFINTATLNKQYHLWTIQDAKDGDVLASDPWPDYSSSFVAIYKKQNEEDFDSYCFVGFDGKFYKGENGHSTEDIHPATKEQRDLLFLKMKEAGYEWNAEKKELKKIEDEEYNGEDYGIDSLFHAQRILEKTLGSVDGYQSDDGILEHKCAISAVKKLYEQKYAWSEEDDRKLQLLIAMCDKTKGDSATYSTMYREMEELKSWLKSLKDRVQPKQEWSEEDEHWRQKTIDFMNHPDLIKATPTLTIGTIDWLKSLRHQSRWKPSEEQLKSLQEVIDAGHYTSYPYALETLYEQLKKLKEE